MMPSHHWARNFTVEKDDIEYLTNLLLERETPLDTETLTRVLIDARINKEVATLRQRYHNARIYDPARTYEVGRFRCALTRLTDLPTAATAAVSSGSFTPSNSHHN